MAKLSGWSPKKREPVRRGPEQVPFEMQEDEIFSYHTFEKTQKLTTRGKLVERFYEWNNTDDGMKPWVNLVLDPEQYTPPGTHSYWFVHFQGYHVHVGPNIRSVHGVHRARLFYTTTDNVTLWLASVQLGPFYFFSQSKLKDAYLEALRTRSFYISERSANRIVAM